MTANVNIVAIASHPDDAEIGVGGILALAAAQGKKTAIIDLSDGEPTPFGSQSIRAAESASASQTLALTTRINLGLNNREITDSVEHRIRLAETLRELRPEIVLVHHSRDNHPDHIAAHHLSIAACFYGKLVKSSIKNSPWSPRRIYEYGGFHLRNRERPSLVVDISSSFLTKMASIRCYHSQFIAHQDNQAVLSDIEADARYWGAQIRTRYGEALFAREMVGIKDIDAFCDL